MGIISRRIDGYLDKYMAMHISEWNLSRCGDIDDLEKRLQDMAKEVDELSSYSVDAMKRIEEMEDRAEKLKTGEVI